MSEITGQLKADIKNPWLRGIIATVVVTVLVNFVFIGYAFWSPPNLVVQDYYEKGKSYFHDQEVLRQQAAQAWRLQLLVPQHVQLNQAQMYRLYAMDHQGTPVQTGDVTLYAYRPSDATFDFQVKLPRSDVGTFAGMVSFPQPGTWDLIVKISSDSQAYDVAQRILVEE